MKKGKSFFGSEIKIKKTEMIRINKNHTQKLDNV